MDITCEVLIDGTKLADTGPDLAGTAPVVLDDLSVTWGRESIAEQPDISSCEFTVRDAAGGSHFRDVLHVGSTVEISATGSIPQTGLGSSYAVDGSFEATTTTNLKNRIQASPAGAAVLRTDGGSDGTKYLRITEPRAAGNVAAVTIPPDYFSTDVTSWDRIPTAEPGTIHQYSIDVRGPAGTAPTVPVTITTHLIQPSGAIGMEVADPVTVTAGSSWQTVTHAVAIPATATPNRWLAVRIQVGAGPYWDAAAGTWDAYPGTWDQTIPVVDIDNLRLYPPAFTSRNVLVWSGRISDIAASPLPDMSGATVRVLAVDSFADLANRYVGDQPWPAETMAVRFGRIVTLSGATGITYTIDPAPGAMVICSRDVDNQSSGGLLAELATSTDAILWFACHTGRGGYIWTEDPAMRVNLEHLAWTGTVWTVKPGPSVNSPDPITLTACDVLADPVQWAQSGDEITTRVDVTYQKPGTPDNIEATYSVVNTAAETVYGVHRYGLSTQLSTVTDATTVANRVLARSDNVDWRMSGIVWDTYLPIPADTATANAAMDLLDGTHRLGLPIAFTDLPAWSPVGTDSGVYCEGGTWQYTEGRWILSMNVTPAGNPGTAIPWNSAPSSPVNMTWNNTDPVQTWNDFDTVGA
jgi:hypothetical protein